MTEVEIAGDAPMVRVQGTNRLGALRDRLGIPLPRVTGPGRADPETARRWRRGTRAPGTSLPGVISEGIICQEGDREFWDARDPDKAVEVRLSSERYARPVIEAEDPDATVNAVRNALRG